MDKDECKKNTNKTLRSYLVYEYFSRMTESDSVTASQINEYLTMYNIYCDNRAIARDIEAINQAHIMLQEELNDVKQANELLRDVKNQLIIQRGDYGKTFSINHKKLNHNDLSMIAECIGAARFLSAKETELLMNILGRTLHPTVAKKIKDQSSQIQREKIRNIYFRSNFDRINKILTPNRWGYYYVNVLVFDYLKYSIEHFGKPLSKQPKEHCEVHPHKIINHNGLYYLAAYDDKKRKMRIFRIDRMINLHVWDDDKNSGVRLAEKMNFATLATRTFDMCLGETTRVTIQCANDLFDTIFERFGMDDVSYRKCDDKCFEVSVILDVSPKFFGWLCGFGKDAKLVSPPSVVEEFAHYLDEIKSQY